MPLVYPFICRDTRSTHVLTPLWSLIVEIAIQSSSARRYSRGLRRSLGAVDRCRPAAHRCCGKSTGPSIQLRFQLACGLW